MGAFRKVPLEMRERLADFTDGNTRLIGGSADTVFIPGRHRQKFMDTLGLFLETNCFLEIATPTALHLTVPPREPILFVDHVRRNHAVVKPHFHLCKISSGGSGNHRSTPHLCDRNGRKD